MDPKSARLPHDLLRSLIVPEVAPLENHLTRTRHAQSGYHSSQHHNPHPNQYDQTTQAPEQAVQGHSAKRHTMSEFVTDFDMEPLPQTPSANIKMPNRPKSNAPVAENGKLYTLEEWDALFPIPKQPAPQPAQQPTQLATSGKAVPLPPKSTNPDAIPRFNHLCQVHSLTSSFTFTEVEQGLFASKLELGDYVYEAAGPFSSKKLAKEAVAARALPTLENIESPLAKNGKRGAAKRTSSANNTPDEENEDWIAVLHEFAQQHRHARPEFQFFEVDTRSQQQRGLCNGPVQYCCTLRIKARPDHAFGSDSMPHLSKAEAKRAAAKDAVTWLRAVDMLPDTASAPTTKRRKSSADEGAHTGLTQAVSRLKTDQSPAQLVAELSLRLGLSPPQYKCTPAGQNSYVCTAHFLKQDEERQPRLKGALCATPSVFGQKNAKKVCAGDLLAVLQRLTAEAGIGE